MKKALLTKIIVAVGAVALLSGFTRCGHRHHKPTPERVNRHIDHKVDDFIDDIDANDSQASQIRGLAERVKAPLPGLMKGHGVLKEELHRSWAAPAPDRDAMHASLDRQLEGVSKFLHELVDVAADLHGILTPEQRKEVEGMHR